MAWTKPTFYMTLILVVSVLIVSLGIVGKSLWTSDRVDLNDESVSYVNTILGESGSYDQSSEKEVSEISNTGILQSEDNATISSETDYVGALNIKKERAKKPTNFFKIAYNIPNTILISLRLPVDEFKHVTNILTYVLLIGITIMVWTKVVRA